MKDKAHFFFSLERPANDRATSIVVPARPEFNASPTTQDRVWNIAHPARLPDEHEPLLERALAA